ncbi:hypothetical protein EW146_g520 [Bondarzewia mesenterica]|uniref:Uncharacterized protein n=1 Tax=Bondarzewia mesenterica TaxID=1095465 RepID=A0A4S4M780_9AGAM|nr:hypothetical protein EW146_g520 [Bondarzewia mesenterica]
MATATKETINTHQNNSAGVVHDALKALGGAPPITQDELTRLCQGAFGDALLFLVQHVRGRSETRDARMRVQALRDRHALRDVDVEWARLGKAEYDVNAGAHRVRQLQAALEEHQTVLATSQKEAERLQMALVQKRRAAMLLDTLERKEEIRKRRVEELGRLMRELSTKPRENLKDDDKNPLPSRPAIDQPKRSVSSLTLITQDTLSHLHAYHIAHAKMAMRKPKAQDQDPTRRLERCLAKVILPPSADVVQAWRDRLISVAYRRATIRLAYVRPHHPPPTSEPEATLARIITQFKDTTAPFLRTLQSDETTATATKDFLFALHHSIIITALLQHPSPPHPSSPTGSSESNWTDALRHTRSMLDREHTTATFLSRTSHALKATNPDPHSNSNSNSTVPSTDTHARLTARLQHKLAKSNAGAQLVRDVREARAEVRAFVHS